MNNSDFRKYGHELIDWMADYFKNIEDYPVTPQISPNSIKNQLPREAPIKSELFDDIFKDFKEIILNGMTHWQHPKFFAYFPANNSYPSILAEMLTSTIGAQCMSWITSPAAAELEEVVMNWLRDMIGLPQEFCGVIQDTASTATLVSILTAREKISENFGNLTGLNKLPTYRVYASEHAHSSIDKAVRIAGLGVENLIKIPVDSEYSMNIDELEKNIEIDIINGFVPMCVVAAFGTTSSVAIDSIYEISKICKKYNIWLHVDAAFAGSALILSEIRPLALGIENADSIVFNPHKWLFTNFDCSAYFIKDKQALLNTFEILPEYLKTPLDKQVNNYRDWGIQLGRRFRALKLWFVIRTFGVENLQNKLREHISHAQFVKEKLEEYGNFEILTPINFNVICFRYIPQNISNLEQINIFNENLLSELNKTGKVFFTHTKLDGKYIIRWVIAQTNVQRRHVEEALELVFNFIPKKFKIE